MTNGRNPAMSEEEVPDAELDTPQWPYDPATEGTEGTQEEAPL